MLALSLSFLPALLTAELCSNHNFQEDLYRFYALYDHPQEGHQPHFSLAHLIFRKSTNFGF
jgi:hypothetical protein